jgi:acetoacetate decarboxylase
LGQNRSSQNRWVQEPKPAAGASLTNAVPPLPSLEVVYLTDPDALAAVLPPPLTPPAQPRVHVRITDIDLKFGDYRHKEMVGYFAVDAVHEGDAGEYPLLIPIDLEHAIAISREKFGEPKKLADIHLVRDGNHVEGRITRDGVTFIEVVGDVAETLPTPDPYPARQFWFKFLPAVDGNGFDAGPFLVRLEQMRKPQSIERIEGKLELRDCASAPVVDLPVLETVSMQWVVRSRQNTPRLVGQVDPDAFAPFVAARYS